MEYLGWVVNNFLFSLSQLFSLTLDTDCRLELCGFLDSNGERCSKWDAFVNRLWGMCFILFEFLFVKVLQFFRLIIFR